MLYDANLPEIRAIVPAADGAIYAAALGGSVARRTSARNPDRSILRHRGHRAAISITVTDAQLESRPAPKPEPAPTPTP